MLAAPNAALPDRAARPTAPTLAARRPFRAGNGALLVGPHGVRPAARKVSRLPRQGAPSSIQEYTALIGTYGQRRYWRKALGVLVELRDEQLEPNAIIYSALVSALGRGQRWEKALGLLQQAQEEEVDPDVTLYSSAISACQSGENWELALCLMQDMAENDVAASVISYSSAIGACGAAQQWAWALQLTHEMVDGGLHPDATAWTAAISAAEAGGQWELALALLTQMPARGLEPDSASFEAALLACAQGRAWHRALGVAAEMRAQQLEPDAAGYSTLLKECEQQALAGQESSLPNDVGKGGGDEEEEEDEASSGQRSGGGGLCAAAANAAAAHRAATAQAGEGRPVQPTGNFLPLAAANFKIPPGSPYSKELRLLQHVLKRARQNDPVSVCRAIESFGKDVLGPSGRWLKVAGDSKAEILTAAVRAGAVGGGILEIGAYCGYSATRMAIEVPEVHLASMEVDPVHVVISRNVLMFGGLAGTVDVWTGHSKDLIPRIEGRYGGPGQLHISAVFMDQKGSLYERDLDAMERQGLLWPGAVVVADNVLKPGAPLFLRKIVQGGDFEAQILNVTEFAMPSEDWMSASVQRPGVVRKNLKPLPDPRRFVEPPDDEPEEPADELQQLNWEADRMRERATGPGRSVTFSEWAAFADKMKGRLDHHGIRVTAVAPRPKPLRKQR